MSELCHIDEITEGDAKGFSRGEHSLFAVKKNDRVYLYRNQCPHLGVPLDWQPDDFLDHEGLLIQCSTHGAQFIIETGKCIVGPCKGRYLEEVPYSLNEGMICLQEAPSLENL